MYHNQEDPFEVFSSPHSKQRKTPQSICEKTPRGSNKSQANSSFGIIRTPSSNYSNENSDSSFEICRKSTIKHEFRVSPKESQKFKVREELIKINEKTLCKISWKPQEVEIDFRHFTFYKEENQQLQQILKQISHIRSLNLIIRNQEKSLANAIIQQLSSVFENGSLRSLESLKIDFFRSQVAAECLDYLNKEVFPKLNSIKSFHINLFDSDVNNEIIQELALSFKENFAEIEDFNCNLGLTKVPEKVIVQFFHKMPKLKHFEMNIGNCEFTDFGMEKFITKTLTSMNSLESFAFKLEATDVMSSQIMDLFKNLPVTLRKLCLDLRFTRTTNEVLKFFIHEKSPILTNLEEVEIKVESTLASKKVKQEIEAINKKYAKKINTEECLKYAQMVKARYSSKEAFDFISLEKEAL